MSLLLCALVFAISCDEQGPLDDDEEDDDDDFQITVDHSLKMSVMTSYEAYQLCKDIADGFNNVIDHEVQCLRKGIAAGQIAGDAGESICNESLLSCLEDKEEDYQKCDKYDETAEKYEGCDAKVSEMDDCLQKTIDTLKKSYSELTCKSEEMLDPSDFEPCSACKDLEEKCPGITTNFDRQFY